MTGELFIPSDGGMRMKMSAIPGVTQGDAVKALAKPFSFQCAPLEEFTVPKSRAFGRYTNYKGSEYLTRGGSSLHQISIRTLLVEWATWTNTGVFNIPGAIALLDRIWQAGYPFALLVTNSYNTTPELQMDAVLESWSRTENAGEGDARYLDLTFTQFREPVIHTTARGEWPQKIIIKPNGDWYIQGQKPFPIVHQNAQNPASLAEFASWTYGKPSLWRHIAAAQKPPILNWGSGTSLFSPHTRFARGGTLTIPKPPS